MIIGNILPDRYLHSLKQSLISKWYFTSFLSSRAFCDSLNSLSNLTILAYSFNSIKLLMSFLVPKFIEIKGFWTLTIMSLILVSAVGSSSYLNSTSILKLLLTLLSYFMIHSTKSTAKLLSNFFSTLGHKYASCFTSCFHKYTSCIKWCSKNIVSTRAITY